MSKRALITGVTGQDGSYLAELLLERGYEVTGVVRPSATPNHWRIRQILRRIRLVEGDLCSTESLIRAVRTAKPDEVYNLAALSFVGTSWDSPEVVLNVNAIGVCRLLNALRATGFEAARFYQASSSEMFGQVKASPQSEDTPFHPRSPYGVAKLGGHWIAVNYRESYDMFCVGGILFNHESPRRGLEFVTRKITSGAARIAAEISAGGKVETLKLGNLNAERDWGHAADYVQAMHGMLQLEAPEDLVIATGKSRSVREFATVALAAAGIPVTWEGNGVEEQGLTGDGRIVVEVDRRFFRPAEVATLTGDAARARERMGWTPQHSFEQLVSEMVEADIARQKSA